MATVRSASAIFLHPLRTKNTPAYYRSGIYRTSSLVNPNHQNLPSRRGFFGSTTKKTTKVSIVYGSHTPHENSTRDAWEIHEVLASSRTFFSVDEPIDGTSFNFNSLAPNNNEDPCESSQKLLILSTSSVFGQPPETLTPFAHNLLLAARTNPGCLSHLHHAVWGRGDPRWYDTYMNVPRYLDKSLEDCGSTRVHARGEFGEPYLEEEGCVKAGEWAERLVVVTEKEGGVPWDALWSFHKTPTHEIVRGFTLEDMMRTHGCLDAGPSLLARPGEEYDDLVEMFREEEEIPRVTLNRARRQR